ncbi:hypothetical protein SSABA_v1c05600 [Spiroplasma sabaudiense Ar-1343]|uniref:Lipoprotein n=1 Tax=Spiroplasma sabaudiense Ar-1343 TaxID=1276257 RepID=W6AJQ7_9MOLU|nr:hypothetical protein [Spiroplasma sabaudiense]AHI53964.1 hypothetical protein SSABA_v1c05600 [Spiroplasma sabaudiense Ar-1343]
MKKLLSILAVSSMIVSVPLNTIACGRNKDRVVDDYDFERQKQLMIEAVNDIFQQNLKNDFDKFFFIKKENNPFEYDYEEFVEKLDDFNNPESDYYQNIKSAIENLVNWKSIENEVQSDVVANVNYKQLLIDNQSPIKNGYEIEKIDFTHKKEAEAVTIQFQISSDVYFLDRIGSQDFETISFTSQMSIFEEVDVAEVFQEIQTEYKKQINSEEVANSFKVLSDKGDLAQTANQISEDETIKSQISLILNQIVADTNRDKFKFVGENFKVRANQNKSTDSSIAHSSPNFSWRWKDEPITTLKGALLGDEEMENLLLEDIKSKDSEFFTKREREEIKNIDQLIAEHEGMALGINSYNLDYNLRKNNLDRPIKNQGSKFAFKPENEEKTIALFRVDFLDLQISYKDDNFELPEMSAIVKQETTKNNTSELEGQFWEDAYFFTKSFYNFDGTSSEESNPDFIYYLNKPENWDELVDKQLPMDDYLQDLIDAANSEALERLNNLGLSLVFSWNAWKNTSPMKNIMFNSDGDVYFYNDMENQDLYPQLRVHFFSSGIESGRAKISFSFNYRSDFNMKQVGVSPSGWKFK